MRNAVIAGYTRSPFTPALKGIMAGIRPDEIVSQTISDLVKKSGISPEDLEDVIMGCAFPEGEQGLNIARLSVFLSKLPNSVGGMTVNRFCGSSMQSIHIAAGAIAANAGDAFICAGVESMSRIPMGGFTPLPHPDLFEEMPVAYISMGITAENLVKKYNISRNDQDMFSLLSHEKAAKAQESGKFADEITTIKYAGVNIDKDECIRSNTSIEALESLKPAFDEKGSVTAGNSSPLTDGAAAVIVCSEEYANHNNLPKLARIKSFAISGCDPEIMGIGPVAATRKALKRANLELKQIDIIELNEAFASQAISCIKELNIDERKVNMGWGGNIYWSSSRCYWRKNNWKSSASTEKRRS